MLSVEATDVRCKSCDESFPLVAAQAVSDDKAVNETAGYPHCGVSASYTRDDFIAGES